LLKWRANFHLARRDIKVYPDMQTVSQLSERFIVKITTDLPFDTAFTPVMNDINKMDYSRCIKVSAEGKTFNLRTVIEFTKR